MSYSLRVRAYVIRYLNFLSLLLYWLFLYNHEWAGQTYKPCLFKRIIIRGVNSLIRGQ
jgi:hypothetical protein